MKVTIEVEKREKAPYVFPTRVTWRGAVVDIAVEKASFKTGDYRLKGSAAAGIERKGGPTELYACAVGANRKRFIAQIERMREAYRYPALMIDCRPNDVLEYDYKKLMPGHHDSNATIGMRVMSALNEICHNKIAVIWMGRNDTGDNCFECGKTALAMLIGFREVVERAEPVPQKVLP